MTSQYVKRGSTVAVKARLVTRTIDIENIKVRTVEVIGARFSSI